VIIFHFAKPMWCVQSTFSLFPKKNKGILLMRCYLENGMSKWLFLDPSNLTKFYHDRWWRSRETEFIMRLTSSMAAHDVNDFGKFFLFKCIWQKHMTGTELVMKHYSKCTVGHELCIMGKKSGFISLVLQMCIFVNGFFLALSLCVCVWDVIVCDTQSFVVITYGWGLMWLKHERLRWLGAWIWKAEKDFFIFKRSI